ncbi:MAG TPA: hypothetical protein PKE40_15735 [Arachnia sp.]|nr:hypothetical protein [Arachnia sp.]HMT87792.1 hypothetical protein [Arachnia sp.]
MFEDEWLDVAAAAERYNCSTKTIWRRIKNGSLPTHTEKVDGRDGRSVVKTLIRVADLNDAFAWADREEHIRKIREVAPPLTAEQKRALGKVLLDHNRDRDTRMGRRADRERA